MKSWLNLAQELLYNLLPHISYCYLFKSGFTHCFVVVVIIYFLVYFSPIITIPKNLRGDTLTWGLFSISPSITTYNMKSNLQGNEYSYLDQ